MSSFIAKLKSTPLPPIKNVLNVALQTARQQMPDKREYEQPGHSQNESQQFSQAQNPFPEESYNGKKIFFLNLIYHINMYLPTSFIQIFAFM